MRPDRSKMEAYEVAERLLSVFSLVGSFIILSTFICWREFRKPINRLIFFATFGNVAANIATLISTSAMRRWHPNMSIALCRFQGVLIQWFLMADSLWAFCMAYNVFLTFFRGYNASQLRSLEKYYIAFCYGIPFIPAFVYLMLDSVGNRGIFGDAVIWCWVSRKWDWMRIAFFYGPVWLVLIVTAAIYIITGHNIFKQRNALRSFTRRPPSEVEVITNPFSADNIANIEAVTKIEVVTEKIQPDGTTVGPASANDSRSSFSSTRGLSNENPKLHPHANPPSRFSRPNWPYQSKSANQEPHTSRTVAISAGNNAMEDEEVHQQLSPMTSPRTGTFRRRDAADKANQAAWGYAKVAFLMFLALFVVWVPSTANRVWLLANPDNPSFALNLTAAIVLPTQGFWNALIYIVTSRVQMRMAARSIACFFRRHWSKKSNPGSAGMARSSTFNSLKSQLHQPDKDSNRTLNSSDHELAPGSEIRMENMDPKTRRTVVRPPPGAHVKRGDSPSSEISFPGR